MTRWAALAVAVLAAGACGRAAGEDEVARRGPVAPEPVVASDASTTVPPETTTTTSPPTTTTTTLPPTTTTAAPPPRVVIEQAWVPFATAGGVTLHHPASRVEMIGFHESNHDGAQDLEPLASAAWAVTLETRDRGTGARTAADIVVDPEAEIRAPVTGTVLRAGSYTLYCDHTDDFAVIEPDEHPGWEIKVFHISGVQVRKGDRVVAGETLLAPHATQLPFESQVDEISADPPWPHVHVELVDPTIPDRPGEGC